MDSAIQQMNHNPLDNYQQDLLSDLMNSDCMVGENWCKIQEIHRPSHSHIFFDSLSQAVFPFTKITVQLQD